MVRSLSGNIQFAPLLILHFPLLMPRKMLDAQKFYLRFEGPVQMTEIADKLRWYRYRKALLQKDVADYIGIDPKTYLKYEEYGRDRYPISSMSRLAELYEIPLEELLDAYHLFLLRGQAEQLKTLRESKKLTQKEFAESIGVPLGKYKHWEQGKVQISKSNWKKYFCEVFGICP